MAQKALMKRMTSVAAILPVRVEAIAVILETGVGLCRRMANPTAHHREGPLAAAMEEGLLGRLEEEQEDQLELVELVEAAVDGEEAPVEVGEASVELQEALVVLKALAEVQDFLWAAMAAIMVSNPAEATMVPRG